MFSGLMSLVHGQQASILNLPDCRAINLPMDDAAFLVEIFQSFGNLYNDVAR